MSDVGKLRRSGGSRLPSVRKSSDPFVPEMGEADFAQDVEEFDKLYTSAVQEPEKTENPTITEENRQKQYRQRKRKRKQKQDDDEQKTRDDDDILIDLKA